MQLTTRRVEEERNRTMRKSIMAVMTAAAVVFGSVTAPVAPLLAEAAQVRANLEISDEKMTEFTLTPGKETVVEIPVNAVIQPVGKAAFTVAVPEEAPFEVGKVKVVSIINGVEQENYSGIGYSGDTRLRFTVKTKETAKIGKYKFVLSYEDLMFSAMDGYEENFSKDLTVTAVISEEIAPAELAISNLKIIGEPKPGNSIDITFSVENSGKLTAKNVSVYANYAGGDLLPLYTDYTKKLGELGSGEKKTVSLKVKVLASATERIVRLPISIDYKDSDGQSLSADANNVIFLELDIPKQEEQKPIQNGNLLVSNVKQYPDKPKAGEIVTMTFDLQNTGERDYTAAKLFAGYTPNVGFEPVSADPYQYIGTIAAGQKKTVSMNVMVGKNMEDGLGVLDVTCEYVDGNGQQTAEKVSLHVLGIQSREEALGNSRPKLMVSEFGTGEEDIKTGESFNFTFKVYNTHSDASAKNIKVTVTSEVFSVTKGSNSFFVSEIKPGQSSDITINLKASAAATTGSYPVNILMEYEYDGMSQTETQNGVAVTETKMILVKENLRVSVESMMLGGWMMPVSGQTTQLSFSIYNMGKSMLNNVYFTLEGDFAIANGSSYYYGMLQAGAPDFVEIDVLPLVSGDAKGTLVIHMEDSNGDEVTFEKELNAFVQEPGNNGGMEPVPNEFPDDPVIPADNDTVKPMIPFWSYCAGIVVLFLTGLFGAKAIRVAIYKKKHENEE